MRRFLIREATLAEFEDLKAFYRKFPDDHVMLRDDAAVTQAISEGVFFIALDTSRPDDERIFAASAVYTIQVQGQDGHAIVLKEAGGSNVAADYRGFGVHKIFHWARALHKFILEGEAFSPYFGAIICPNEPSEKNIAKAGFEDWNEPPEALAEERAPYAGDGQQIKFYKFPREALAEHARQLLLQEGRGFLERHAAQDRLEQVETHLVLETLKRYRPILTRLAADDFSDFV